MEAVDALGPLRSLRKPSTCPHTCSVPMHSHVRATIPHLTFLGSASGVAPLCLSVRPTSASESAKSDSSRGPEDLRAQCKRSGPLEVFERSPGSVGPEIAA